MKGLLGLQRTAVFKKLRQPVWVFQYVYPIAIYQFGQYITNIFGHYSTPCLNISSIQH